jgi:hypothetical protein
VWELSLGIYLIVKGFKVSPITPGSNGHLAVDDGSPSPAVAAL